MSACPKCQVFNTHVHMTRRLRNGWVKRWRVCAEPACKAPFRTIEIPEEELDLDPDAPGLWACAKEEEMTSKTCPPCHGDCNQGRECPARRPPKDYVVDPDYFWRPIITAPLGAKIQLLTAGGVAIHGRLTLKDVKDGWYKGWTPLPKIPESVK